MSFKKMLKNILIRVNPVYKKVNDLYIELKSTENKIIKKNNEIKIELENFKNKVINQVKDISPDLENNRNISNSIIENKNIQIVNINYKLIQFFQVIGRDKNDPISSNARNGRIEINNDLFNLFPGGGGKCFLDLGGNIGAFSLSFGAMGWKGYTFEASSFNANLLSKSVNINDFNIKIVNKAVYEHTGNIYFGQNGPFGLIQNSITQGIKWEEIPCVCLDDWFVNENMEKIDFIKMDIEGSEVAALKGMKKFLDKFKFPPIFVESNSYTLFLQNETQKSLLKEAYDLGYIPYILQSDNLIKYDINNFPTVMVADFLLIKDMPDNLRLLNIIDYKQTPDEVVAYVIESLTRVYENNSYSDKSTCYALKDFPEYISNIRINDILQKIMNNKGQDKYSDKYLGWFKSN